MALAGGNGGEGVGWGWWARAAVVQRHNSDEHYLLGQLTPDQIGKLADGRVESDASIADASKTEKIKSLFGTARQQNAQVVTDATHVIDAELVVLNRLKAGDWPTTDEIEAHTKKRRRGDGRRRRRAGRAPGMEPSVGPHPRRQRRRGRPASVTSTPSRLRRQPRRPHGRPTLSVVIRLLQIIRREAYIGLMKMKAGFAGKQYEYDPSKTKNDFVRIEGMASGTPRALGDMQRRRRLRQDHPGQNGRR